MYHGISEAIHKELEMVDQRLSNGTAMNASELDQVDKMFHALKCLKTYEAMEGNSEYDSYARGRSRTTGRYISRDEDPRDYRRY